MRAHCALLALWVVWGSLARVGSDWIRLCGASGAASTRVGSGALLSHAQGSLQLQLLQWLLLWWG